MARIEGVDLPRDKRVEIGLTYIYGIGRSSAQEILEKLFDSPVKVKLLKFFMRNPDNSFEMNEIAKKTKTSLPACRGEIKKLESIKLINGK